ncbi:MAG: dihydroorotase, partial [Bacteroidetes bacterium]|nr:dihydroorotase [Bacteroidota bacterium]
IIRNARLINEGEIYFADIQVEGQFIARIERNGIAAGSGNEVDGEGCFLLPGVIDDQVHFREPGLTHKAEIFTESRAALAGGVTSYMEMPNVVPKTTTIEKLEEKMKIGAARSAVNYSFFMGTTNDNLEELKKVDPLNTCGVKIFMGSSTGDMLVDDEAVLDKIFSEIPVLIATHCENETRVKERLAKWIQQYGEDIPAAEHARIRDEEACLLSSSFAKELALKHNTRLHILHITTAEELALFRNDIPLEQKRITSEVCVHHLHFTADDYATLGNFIKCNPAIKAARHKEALWQALLDDRLDIIATDHAPHTLQEKQMPYAQSPSGLPLVQHSLQLMLNYVSQGKITYEKVIDKMCHKPAVCFQLDRRGYIREGYYADLVLVKPNSNYKVSDRNLLYKCGWSPLNGMEFNHSIEKVWVNGTLGWDGKLTENYNPMRLNFNR